MDVGAATHPGYVRTANEDGFFASNEKCVFAVADGMGGHEHGEVACRLALEAIAKRADILSNSTPGELANDLYDAVQSANQSILSHSEKQDTQNRMGTTLVLATVCGDRLYFAHIGDSRIYLLRGDGFTQLTRDHSLVQTMVDSGEISAEEAAVHPLRHKITRVVGGEQRISPEIASQSLEPGDKIILCSDGLSGAVSLDIIKSILIQEKPAQERADLLVQAALSAGGPDNITAVILDYTEPRPIPEKAFSIRSAARAHGHFPALASILFTVLGIIILALIGASWQYLHPRYAVATGDDGTLAVYKNWPLLPMLTRQQVPSKADIPSVSIDEAKPFLTDPRFQPRSGDMADGITVEGEEAGMALLDNIVKVTAAGMLDTARTKYEQKDLPGAESALLRAEALHINPIDAQALAFQIEVAKKQLSDKPTSRLPMSKD